MFIIGVSHQTLKIIWSIRYHAVTVKPWTRDVQKHVSSFILDRLKTLRFPIWWSVVLNGIDGILMYLTPRDELKVTTDLGTYQEKQFQNMGNTKEVH